MSHELRESLVEAFPNPQDYYKDMGPHDRIVCLATISFTDNEKNALRAITDPSIYQGVLGISAFLD